MIMAYVICLFLLIDCLYWQVLNLSIVLCLCLLERKSQAQSKDVMTRVESCCTYFFQKCYIYNIFATNLKCHL